MREQDITLSIKEKNFCYEERKTEKKNLLTLDNNTVASNPGNIEFQPLVWLKHKPEYPVLYALLIIVSVWLSVQYSYYCLILVLLLIGINSFYWVMTKESFMADSNPGIIVSVSPPLYAVYTNLSKGSGHYPVVKVIRYRKRRHIEIGDRIATISTYCDENGEESPSWSDFFPNPAEYATSNKSSIFGELDSYTEDSWALLKSSISSLSPPLTEGLHKLENENNDW